MATSRLPALFKKHSCEAVTVLGHLELTRALERSAKAAVRGKRKNFPLYFGAQFPGRGKNPDRCRGDSRTGRRSRVPLVAVLVCCGVKPSGRFWQTRELVLGAAGMRTDAYVYSSHSSTVPVAGFSAKPEIPAACSTRATGMSIDRSTVFCILTSCLRTCSRATTETSIVCRTFPSDLFTPFRPVISSKTGEEPAIEIGKRSECTFLVS